MSNETKVTAVEWLIQQISERQPNGLYVIDSLYDVKWVFDQAKAIEKQQIIDAVDGFPLNKRHLEGGQYYTETYGK